MRIAIVTTSWPSGPDDAAGHFVRAEARELERQGHAVEVVRPPPGGAFGWPGVAARVRERPLRALDAARWVATSLPAVRRLRVDRVVAHWAVPCAFPIGAAASGAELSIVSHGGDVRLLVGLPGAVRLPLVGALVARASQWRFVSVPLLEELLAAVGGPVRARLEAIATVTAPPLEMPDVAEAAAALRAALAGQRVAVTVARLVPTKRVDRAIELVARTPVLDALVVVGDGPERERLERLARARGVDARFLGQLPRAEALAWIAAAEVLVHASEREGLSTVVREAAALGTRVVDLTPGAAVPASR